MGIMTAKKGEEIFEISKKIRNQMNAIKGGVLNTAVIIQEGIPTADFIEGHPSEPMVYSLGGETIGCMYRINNRKDRFGNLNASGMSFHSLDSLSEKEQCSILNVIAKLAGYAAAWECYDLSFDI